MELELTIRLILNCLAVLPLHSLAPPLAIALALAIGMAIKLDIPQSACPSLIRCINRS
jgi:hypothetical protein